MKILHISPASPFNEGWGYQENLLPKYQAKLDNEVMLIVTNKTFFGGKIIETKPTRFFSKDGFEVVTLKKHFVLTKKISEFLSILKIKNYLEAFSPDLIFVHGLSNLTIKQVIKYKRKHRNAVIFIDNHADYNIGPKSRTLFQKLARLFWRVNSRNNDKWISKYYGVTPWRMAFANDYYGIPNYKIDLLIMGADDEKIDIANKAIIKAAIRKKYNVKDDDFLIVTGGKLDRNKKVVELLKACALEPNVKIIVFGDVLEDIKITFDKLTRHKNIIYIGWIPADSVYNYFAAADLIAFPGQHSVLWEQACASKTPCIFGRWNGMNHINNGGNSAFFSNSSVKSIKKDIDSLVFTEAYYSLKNKAESSLTDIFLYSNIAKKTIKDYEKAR